MNDHDKSLISHSNEISMRSDDYYSEISQYDIEKKFQQRQKRNKN